ncbi:ABC transporter substrate-binding protein [Paenibacillus hodogayensis]|uniref:ABC transporter substrate-binding protein n=1 Tax=Paenibacillus hodogayensis TaxID=279208 RepID=A0ABV5W6S4_9BACL
MKKSLHMIVMLTMTAALLGACSGGAGTNDGKESEGQGAEKPVKDITKEPAEIIFYSNNGDPTESFDYRFGDSIRKKFPNYTIKYIMKGQGTNLPELLASGTRFDIFFQTIGNFESSAFDNGIEYDMSGLIASSKLDLNRFEPSIIEAIKQTSGGKMFALPISNTNLILYYNKSLFDKFGAAYPKDGMTWEQVTELSKKLSRNEGGTQYYGLTQSSTHSVRMRQLSIPLADLKTDTPSINTDDRWKTFFQTVFINPTQEASVKEAISKENKVPSAAEFAKTKNVAMFNYVSTLMTVWEKEFKELDWDMVSMPTFQDMPGIGSQSYPAYFGITKMAQNKEAAMEVLKYMVSDEFQTELARKGIMPVLKNEAIQKEMGKDSPFKDKNWGAVFYNKFAPIPPLVAYEAQLAGVYQAYGTKAQIGTVDLNTAMRQAEEDAKKQIADFKQKQGK